MNNSSIKNLKENLEIITLNTRYASESLSEIPMGYWIDKSVGGCGLSYLALTDNNDSIILMPRNKLIENKISQKDKYNNLLAVNTGVTKYDINRYITNVKKLNLPIKILVTYDSFALGKLDDMLDNEISRIYVDESQFILDFALTKPLLVNELHNRLSKYIDKVTFFSAHPPKREYLPEYIQTMSAIKYNWINQTKATPYTIDTDKPYMVATKILSDLLVNGSYTIGDITFKKAIVFLNSVEGLKRIIEPLNSKDNISYVVGDTLRNDIKLNDYATPLKDCNSLPPVTVGTTSLISGYDLYDEETLNIVISKSSKNFTLMDKELDVPQAITRQRLDSNPHNNKFIFILDVKDMDDKIQKLESTYDKDYKKLTKVVDNLNCLKQYNKDYTMFYELYEGYCFLENDIFIINENLLKAKKYIFQELYKQYEKGYSIISTNQPAKNYKINSATFYNKTYKDYVKQIKECNTLSDKMKILNSITNSKWKEYISYGLEQNKLLVNVKEAKEFYESKSDYKSIILTLRKLYKPGVFYSNVDIKNQLQKLYDNKCISKKAKSTDLYEFFEVKPIAKRLNDKIINGLLIKRFK